MKPLDGLRDVFIKALREIPDDDCVGYIGVKSMLIDKWNKEIDHIQKHYDFTYISTNKEVSESNRGRETKSVSTTERTARQDGIHFDDAIVERNKLC